MCLRKSKVHKVKSAPHHIVLAPWRSGSVDTLYNLLEVSLNLSAYFLFLFLKKECSPSFCFPFPSVFFPLETPTFQYPTVRSRWTHICYTGHKYCCTPAVPLVQAVLGYGLNACTTGKKFTVARAYRVHRETHTWRAGSEYSPSVYHRSEHTIPQRFRINRSFCWNFSCISPMAHPSW